jgi:hypothetical protein
MKNNAGDHGKEGIPPGRMDLHIAKHIVVKDAIVDTLTGCPLTIGIFPFIAVSGNPRIEADIVRKWHIDGTAIVGDLLLTLLPVRAGINFTTGKWAAVLVAPLNGVKLREVHPCIASAADIAVGIIGKAFRKTVGVQGGFHVKVDHRDNPIMFEEVVGRIVVMGGIQTEPVRKKKGVVIPKIGIKEQKVEGIMTTG